MASPKSPARVIQTTRYVPPPQNLPILGKMDPRDITFIGETNYADALEEKRFIFGIKKEDRRRHVYIAGKSGSGKTKLLESMVRQDIKGGHCMIIIDTQGGLADEVQNSEGISSERLVHLDLRKDTNTWNPLESVPVSARHETAENIVELISGMAEGSWNAELEYLARMSVLALFDLPGVTLGDMRSLLLENSLRERAASSSTDSMVRRFWAEEYSSWRERYESTAILPMQNIWSKLLGVPGLQTILSSASGSFRMDEIIRGEKILLVVLPASRIGPIPASFGVGLILGALKAALSITHPPVGRDAYLYVDELFGSGGGAYERLLPIARQGGLATVVSHQYGAQMSQKPLTAILGAVGTVILFRLSGEDANRLRTELGSVFEAKDILSLGLGEYYIKLLIDGEASEPFSARTLRIQSSPR